MNKSKIEYHSNKSKEMKRLVKDIIFNLLAKYDEEKGTRILNENYRVTFVPRINNNKKETLGYCEKNRNSYNLCFSEIIFSEGYSGDQLGQIVGHETAHLIDYSINGSSSHGKNFKEICKFLGVEGDQAILKKAEKESKILNKIKKLLALSESSFENEANSSLLKAKELMREYGLKERTLNENDKKIYRVALETYKSFTSEIRVVTQVTSLISGAWMLLSYDEITYQKVIYAHGTKTECEIAQYLYGYIKTELAKQYKKAKKENNFYGSSKPSFYLGAHASLKERFDKQEKKEYGLINYTEENRKLATSLIYSNKKMGYTKSNRVRFNASASLSGKESGKNLKIRNGISNGSRKEVLQLA